MSFESLFPWIIIGLQWAWLIHLQREWHRAARLASRAFYELGDAWRVFGECAKVLDMHDDFDSRHVRKLIDELHSKYPMVDPRKI